IAPSQEEVNMGKIAAPPPPDYKPIKRDIPLTAPAEAPVRPVEANPVPAPAKPAAPVQKKSSTRGLFLRLPSADCPQMPTVLRMVTEFSGPTTVHFYYEDTKKYNMETGIKTSVTATLYGKLQQLLGSSNVVLKN
ncbi:MAG: hypothetical protein IKV76_01330, partial [Clostridia bacterium]|nr:hypothetical protein [Clostridia bacterium]